MIKWSTTTKIEPKPIWILGRPKTKFILISSEGVKVTCKGVYSPLEISLDLAYKHDNALEQIYSYGLKRTSL